MSILSLVITLNTKPSFSKISILSSPYYFQVLLVFGMPTFIKLCFTPKAKPEGKAFKAVESPLQTQLKPGKQRVRSVGSYTTVLIALLSQVPNFKDLKWI